MMFDNDTSIPLLLAVKLPVTALGAYLSGERGLIFPVLLFLFVSMIVDWITGVMADKANGKPITSKTFSAGIFKKVSYLIATGLGLGFDWLLHVTSGYFGFELPVDVFFGMLVALWYCLNELLSITENLDEMGANVPKWLKAFIKVLKGKIDKAGGDSLNKIESGKNKNENS